MPSPFNNSFIINKSAASQTRSGHSGQVLLQSIHTLHPLVVFMLLYTATNAVIFDVCGALTLAEDIVSATQHDILE